jgi:hypothetical protein
MWVTYSKLPGNLETGLCDRSRVKSGNKCWAAAIARAALFSIEHLENFCGPKNMGYLC